MTWIKKEQPTAFDEIPIPGLFLLNGDFLFALTRDGQFRGVKRPMISFPSGSNRALWPERKAGQVAEFYLFGEMALPVRSHPDEAFKQVAAIAAEHGYGVSRVGEDTFEVWDERDYDHFRVSYDCVTGYVVDVVSLRTASNQPTGG